MGESWSPLVPRREPIPGDTEGEATTGSHVTCARTVLPVSLRRTWLALRGNYPPGIARLDTVRRSVPERRSPPPSFNPATEWRR